MYEKEHGPKRLARALHDTDNIKALAHYLRYEEKQLGQDIEAMYNHFYGQGGTDNDNNRQHR